MVCPRFYVLLNTIKNGNIRSIFELLILMLKNIMKILVKICPLSYLQ